jgi:hypothetical protein
MYYLFGYILFNATDAEAALAFEYMDYWRVHLSFMNVD